MFKFTFIEVEFPTLSYPMTRAAEVNFGHALYEHETAKIYFTDWNHNYNSIAPGTPVTITLRSIRGVKRSHMYVNHIKPDFSPDKRYLEMSLIGASFPMKKQSQKTWVNATADQIIADIAISHNFSYVAIPHPRIFEQVIQAGKSDWELMVSLAKKCGYALKAVNTAIHFQPLTHDFTEKRGNAHYFSMSNLTSKQTGIYSFTPLIGEAVPYEDAQKGAMTVSGTDPRTGVTHAHKGTKLKKTTRRGSVNPAFERIATHTVARTWEDAKYEAEAAVERSRYAYRGKVVINGAPELVPGDPIFLAGVGNAYSGYWTVLSIDHSVENTKYFKTTLIVGTDSLGLSAQWEDGKVIESPSQNITRQLSPGKKQTNVKPVTFLKTTGKNSKRDSSNHFSTVKSSSSGKVSSSPSYMWEGVPVNLQKTVENGPSKPLVVLQKLQSRRGGSNG